MKFATTLGACAAATALAGFAPQSQAQSFTQGFNGTTVPTGWVTTNLSTPVGSLWNDGPGISDGVSIVVSPQEGDGFAIVNYTSLASGAGTINNWLISPVITGLKNGDKFSFYTTTTPGSSYPDRLEFRLSTAGSSVNVGATNTSVGDFTTTLASVNPSLAFGGYPETWSLVTATVSGLAIPVSGRVAFRYFVTDGGPTGNNSNIIGVDALSYVAAAVPEPATWAMSASGVACLLGLARLRRKAASAAA